ncbi:MAG: hypothetical protein EOM64_00470 [Erysipelotrichia bacterium]|nr:hypothetical protein [Erysipelotrichia bacterium]
MNHHFLRSAFCLTVYLILILLIIAVNDRGKQELSQENVNSSSTFRKPQVALIAAVIILLSGVKGLGFCFPLSQSVGGTISLEFSRAFYAAGLISAGLIGDRNRKYVAVCCLAALVFPFISFVLKDVPAAASVLWILGYVFFGFFSVYRISVFCDIAAKTAA